MSPNDQGALIARSKCYLQLGEPEKALLDAETALEIDKNSIRAIYQKAESLYYLGKFEHSLMFFHRGLRLRPELNNFRLGRFEEINGVSWGLSILFEFCGQKLSLKSKVSYCLFNL